MKRKHRSHTGQQDESCGIWLDTSARRKHKVQTLIAKPAFRALDQLFPCPAPMKTPRLFMKQTIISTFFSNKPEGEKLVAAVSESTSTLQGCTSPRAMRHRLPVPPLQPLLLQEHRLPTELGGSLLTPACDNSRGETTVRGRSAAAAGEDPFSLDFAHPLKENRICTAVSHSPSRAKASGWRKQRHSRLGSDCGKELKHLPCTSPSSCSEAEYTHPRLEGKSTAGGPLKGFNQSGAGACLETISNSRAGQRQQNRQEEVVGFLFTQDSQGHKVISHPQFIEQSTSVLQKMALCHQSNPVPSSFHTSCCGAAGRSPPHLPGVSTPGEAEVRLQSSYDLLFTQDSEGNQVIKH